MRVCYAHLLEHFHLTPTEIRDLTDRQIRQLFFHKRNEKGVIKEEDEALPEGSFEADMLSMQIMHNFYKFKEQTLRDQLLVIYQKWKVPVELETLNNKVAAMLKKSNQVITGERIVIPKL